MAETPTLPADVGDLDVGDPNVGDADVAPPAAADAAPLDSAEPATSGKPRLSDFAGLIGALLGIGILLSVGLSSFGIWDPWELTRADEARELLENPGLQLDHPSLGPSLVANSFNFFGVEEWTGRAPMVVCGLLALLAIFFMVSWFSDRRTGLYAVIASGTTPLFILNSRQMLGEAPGLLAQVLMIAFGSWLLFPRAFNPARAQPESRLPPTMQRAAPWIALVLLGLSGVMSVMASGALVGALPALLALSTAGLMFHRPWNNTKFAPGTIALALVVFATFVIGYLVVEGVIADRAEYSHWLGGTPEGGDPPTFEVNIERIFHSLAPWSALFPVAIGLLVPKETETRKSAFKIVLLVWASAGYAAMTLYGSRYGTTTFLAGIGLCIGVAFLLRQIELSNKAWTGAAVISCLLTGLLIRDFSLYPGGPVDGLSLSGVTVPEEFNPRKMWASFLGLFAAALALGFATSAKPQAFGERLRIIRKSAEDQPWFFAVFHKWVVSYAFFTFLKDPVNLLKAQAKRGAGFAAWIVIGTGIATSVLLFAGACVVMSGTGSSGSGWLVLKIGAPVLLVLLPLVGLGIRFRKRGDDASGRPKGSTPGEKLRVFFKFLSSPCETQTASWMLLVLLVFGIVVSIIALTIPSQLALTTVVLKWGKRLGLVVLAVPVIVLAAQIAWALFNWLGKWRLMPLIVAGFLVGAYTSQGFLPDLSSHFSPRDVYESYNDLREDGDTLGEYGMGSRAAAYYADGETETLATHADVIAHLGKEGRQWVVFPADELAQINRLFREDTGNHLFIADARSLRTLLATSSPIPGRDNQNFVANTVLDEAPDDIQYRVNGKWENKIQLIGYDLELPHEGYVGAGESFTVVWYYQVLERIPGSYKIFLHVDGQGLRLNGDHDPLDGRYPLRLWDVGDVIVDRQPLDVPSNYRPGRYTMWLGFWPGGSGRRLEIVEGEEDDVDRLNAGTLIIR